MTHQDFITKYNGKGIDFDGYFGCQCMDLYRQYVKDVYGFAQSPGVTGAKNVWTTYNKEHFDRIDNTPDAIPQQGDIVIWGEGIGPYGHIAVFDHGDVKSFTSFDQNWPVGTLCHFQQHNYTNVLGWLRAKTVAKQEVQLVQKLDLSSLDNNTALKEVYGVLDQQTIEAKFKAKDQLIVQQQQKLAEMPQNASNDPTDNILDSYQYTGEINITKANVGSRLLTWLQSLIDKYVK